MSIFGSNNDEEETKTVEKEYEREVERKTVTIVFSDDEKKQFKCDEIESNRFSINLHKVTELKVEKDYKNEKYVTTNYELFASIPHDNVKYFEIKDREMKTHSKKYEVEE